MVMPDAVVDADVACFAVGTGRARSLSRFHSAKLEAPVRLLLLSLLCNLYALCSLYMIEHLHVSMAR